MSDSAPSQIHELKVSGHTMALEPGLYCIFNAPGAATPAPESGLPGVRVTAAPGRHAGHVSVAGFHADGWIGADAGALVRITDGAATVLVTVYQEVDSKLQPPALQVLRLSGETGQGGQAVQGQQRSAPENVEVVAHVYALGDVPGRIGDWVGEPGSKRWIEGFGISPMSAVPQSDIEYQAVLGRGWLSPWSEGGQFCGSRGMSLPILGLRVRLRGASAKTHKVALSATFVDGTKVGPVADGEPCEARSLAALEAFQVQLLSISAPAKPRPAVSGKPVAKVPRVMGRAAPLAEVPVARAKVEAAAVVLPPVPVKRPGKPTGKQPGKRRG